MVQIFATSGGNQGDAKDVCADRGDDEIDRLPGEVGRSLLPAQRTPEEDRGSGEPQVLERLPAGHLPARVAGGGAIHFALNVNTVFES